MSHIKGEKWSDDVKCAFAVKWHEEREKRLRGEASLTVNQIGSLFGICPDTAGSFKRQLSLPDMPRTGPRAQDRDGFTNRSGRTWSLSELALLDASWLDLTKTRQEIAAQFPGRSFNSVVAQATERGLSRSKLKQESPVVKPKPEPKPASEVVKNPWSAEEIEAFKAFWTAEYEKRLRKEKAFSRAEIAAHFNRTEPSVDSKARNLSLPALPTLGQAKNFKGAVGARKEKKERIKDKKEVKLVTVKPAPIRQPVIPVMTIPASFPPGLCAVVVGRRSDKRPVFCSCPVVQGKTFCIEHLPKNMYIRNANIQRSSAP